jgi:predicted O-methyltransferase YrrM
MRYERLIQEVYRRQPKAILEVGTWNGERALQMLQASPGAKYYGFDLFETATRKTDAEEKNVKPHYSLAAIKARLTGYDAKLYKGNTRETLAEFNEPVDFAWIDGGHSVETIRSDLANVLRVLIPGGAVFLDDYYSGGIDTEQYGCNKVVEGWVHEVLPDKDPVVPSGFVQMVRLVPVDPYLQTR